MKCLWVGVAGAIAAGLMLGGARQLAAPPEQAVARSAAADRLPALPNLPPPALAVPVAAAAEDGPKACRTFQVPGAHAAPTQTEAQEGAIEDMSDICPAHPVTQVQQQCEPFSPVKGVLLQRCRAEGLCHVCGEHLARYRELHQGKP